MDESCATATAGVYEVYTRKEGYNLDPMPLAASGVTHQGRRSTNEDAWLVDLDLGLLVVADGMGATTRVRASALAVKVIRDVFRERRNPPSQALLIQRVQSANQQYLTAAADNPPIPEWGRRSSPWIVDERAYYTSVGDSRVPVAQRTPDATHARRFLAGGDTGR